MIFVSLSLECSVSPRKLESLARKCLILYSHGHQMFASSERTPTLFGPPGLLEYQYARINARTKEKRSNSHSYVAHPPLGFRQAAFY
jgi:hypothetical protein